MPARKSVFDYLGNIISLTKTNNGIDAVNLVKKLLTFPFRQTACDNHFFYGAAEFVF